MITEYCSHGDLLNFLRAHAHNFMTSVLNVNEHEEEAFYKNLAAQNTRVRRFEFFCFNPRIEIRQKLFNLKIFNLVCLFHFRCVHSLQ